MTVTENILTLTTWIPDPCILLEDGNLRYWFDLECTLSPENDQSWRRILVGYNFKLVTQLYLSEAKIMCSQASGFCAVLYGKEPMDLLVIFLLSHLL